MSMQVLTKRKRTSDWQLQEGELCSDFLLHFLWALYTFRSRPFPLESCKRSSRKVFSLDFFHPENWVFTLTLTKTSGWRFRREKSEGIHVYFLGTYRRQPFHKVFRPLFRYFLWSSFSVQFTIATCLSWNDSSFAKTRWKCAKIGRLISRKESLTAMAMGCPDPR